LIKGDGLVYFRDMCWKDRKTDIVLECGRQENCEGQDWMFGLTLWPHSHSLIFKCLRLRKTTTWAVRDGDKMQDSGPRSFNKS
jgi:hypothetical protein